MLAQNRFENSKAFYEAHKEALKQGATIPMRQVMLDLSETLLNLDEEIYVDPVYTVSRIRRDTRYTKDKTLYRENLWIMFRRHKQLYRNCPAMWFEIGPQGYGCGIGFYTDKPRYMDLFREAVLEQPDQFRAALAAVHKANLHFCGEAYKKPKVTDAPEDLLAYLNTKDITFLKESTDLIRIEDDTIIKKLKKMITTVEPMYRFLLNIHFKITEKELNKC